jgi:hypothetical protein
MMEKKTTRETTETEEKVTGGPRCCARDVRNITAHDEYAKGLKN